MITLQIIFSFPVKVVLYLDIANDSGNGTGIQENYD
jgi:hypothetical protein